MASMVSSTVRSVSEIPEFQEFQPIGGVCTGWTVSRAGELQAASRPTQIAKPASPRTRTS